MNQYEKWIEKNIMDYSSAYGKCKDVCKEMQRVFPELILSRGHYHSGAWGKRMHWWLKTPEGKTVDPTKKQFSSNGKGKYIELDTSLPEPIGKCVNCGGHCYKNPSSCSSECSSILMAEFNGS